MAFISQQLDRGNSIEFRNFAVVPGAPKLLETKFYNFDVHIKKLFADTLFY